MRRHGHGKIECQDADAGKSLVRHYYLAYFSHILKIRPRSGTCLQKT